MNRFTLHLARCACVLTLLCSAPAYAAELSEAEVLQQLRQLISQQQFQQAYELAEQYAAQLEGDATFDLYHGISATQVGAHETAHFSFDRLANNYPNILRYRLELARSYFLLGNLDRAEQEFQHVLNNGANADVQKTVQQYLDSINEQRRRMASRLSASLALSAGYDSNYNSASSLETIDIFNGVLTARIDPKQQQREAAFHQLRGHIGYIHQLTRRSALDINIIGGQKDQHDSSDYDMENLGAAVGLRSVRGAHQFRAGLSYNHYWLGQEALQQDMAANLDWYWQVSSAWQPFVRASAVRIENNFNPLQDMQRFELQMGTGWQQGRFSSQIALIGATDVSENNADYLARDTFGLSLSGQYRFQRGQLYSTLMLRDYQFQDDYPSQNLIAGNQTRDETLLQGVLGYRHLLSKRWSTYAQISYTDLSSNIALYQYDRTLAEVGISLSY